MSYTTNLGLPLMPDTPEEGVTGLDLRKMINGENEDSMAQILDKIIEPNTNKATAATNATMPDDDNKFPTCALVKKTISNTGGLPEVTTEDNGKVLGIVDGQWAKMDAPNGCLTGNFIEILPETTLNNFEIGTEGAGLTKNGVDFSLVVNEQYTVIWDGVEYKIIAKDIAPYGATFTVLGNASFISEEEENTGEPFLLYSLSEQTIYATNDMTKDSHTVAIYQEKIGNYLTTEDKEELVKLILDNELFSNDEMTFSYLSTIDRYTWHQIGSSAINFIPGEIYYVEWDGKFYKCIAGSGSMGGDTYHGIGNTTLVGIGEDTGEPFGFVYNLNNPQNIFVSNDTEKNTHSVKIYQKVSSGTSTESGSSLPEVTESDNGKHLEVENGVWTVKEINTTEQVQADWDEKDTSSPAYIKNKPVISAEGGASVQANWEQTDETQADFIKNKPFGGTETLIVDVIPLKTYGDFYLNSTYNLYIYEVETIATLTTGDYYTVSWDGIEYECVAQDVNSVVSGMIALGNCSALGLSGNNEPFIVGAGNGWLLFASLTDTEAGGYHSVCITKDKTVVKKLDPKFLPIPFFGEGGTTSTELVPTTDMQFVYDGSMYMYFNEASNEQMILWNSDCTNATVTWDGVEYICEPQYIQDIKVIGNIDFLMGSGDNGMPFAFAMEDNAYMIMSTVDFSEEIYTEYQDAFAAPFSLVDGENYYTCDNEISIIAFIEGTTYIVSWNSSWYDSMATLYTSDDATYIGVGNPSILGLGNDTGDEYFIYTKTLSDGTQSSGVVTTNTNASNTFGIIYAPDVTHNVGVMINQTDIVTIDSKFIGEVSWDKVTNKPFGAIPAGTVVVDKTTVNCSIKVGTAYAAIINEPDIVAGVSYEIECDGTTNICVAEATSNGGVSGVAVAGKDESCIIYKNYVEGTSAIISTQGSHTFKISLAEDIIKTIEPEFIPKIDSLPEVTTSDNNKVMTVVNGVWTVQTPASGLPEVTTSDAGKFLRVGSNGTWIVEAIQDVSEVGL